MLVSGLLNYIYISIYSWMGEHKPKKGENIVSTNMILTVDDLSVQATSNVPSCLMVFHPFKVCVASGYD
jgi:hypothetical protein